MKYNEIKQNRMNKKINKKALEIDEILLWTIAIISLAIIIIGIFIFRKGGENLIEKLISLFRYR